MKRYIIIAALIAVTSLPALAQRFTTAAPTVAGINGLTEQLADKHDNAAHSQFSSAKEARDVGQDAVIGGKAASSTFNAYTSFNNAAVALKANTSALGSAAFANQTSFGTWQQGEKADTALQPGDVFNEVYANDFNAGTLTSATINAALADIGAEDKTLVLPPGIWVMSTDITIPENVTFMLQPGAVLQRTGGTLTINGSIDFPWTRCLSGFISGSIVWGDKIEDIYIDWQALADGSDDYYNIQSLITKMRPETDVHFGVEESYNIAAHTLTLSSFSGGNIYGYGSRIYGNNTAYGLLSAYNQISNNTGLTVAITKDLQTFTIPVGVTIVAGNTVRLIPSAPYVYNYYAGHLARVVSVSGSTATMDIPPLNTFTASAIEVFTGVNDAQIRDLTFDSSGATTAITSANIYASNTDLVNLRFIGADNAAAGLTVIGNNVRILKPYATGYLNKVGVSGGRTGYGISAAGNNITIDQATVRDCKHDVSLGGDRYIMSNNNKITNSTLTQDPVFYGQELTIDATQHAYVTTVVDAHSNLEQWELSNNTITGASVVGVISVRNGKGVFTGNTIRQANTDTDSNIIITGERTLTHLALIGNDIKADTAGIPLVRTAGNALDGIASATPFYASEQAVKLSANEIDSGITWKGCTAKGDKLYASAAPTSFTWELNDFVHNSNQTAGSVLGWRCVVAGTPGTWEAVVNYSLPTASDIVLGGVKVDGTSITISDGVISAPMSGGGTVTAVTGTAPVVSSGGTAPAISMTQASGSADGYLTSANWTTFNSKGSGDVAGPASSADNEIVRFDGTTGKAVQRSSNVIVTDAGNIATTQTDQSVEMVVQNSSATVGKYPKIIVRNYDGAAGYGGFPSIQTQAAKGTSGSPTAVTNGMKILNISGSGYGSTNFKIGAALTGVAVGTFSDADQPADMVMEVGKVGSSGSPTERLRIESTGAIRLALTDSATATADRVKLYHLEGDYLHILDEDSNDARIGQKTLSLGAASGGTATIESTSHATKGLLTIPNAVEVTAGITGTTITATTGFVGDGHLLTNLPSSGISDAFNHDFASIAAGGTDTATRDVTGAILGDHVLVSETGGVVGDSLVLTGHVYQTGRVRIRAVNPTASAYDAPTAVYNIRVLAQ